MENGTIMRKKVLLVGPILSQSGYGEHARFIFRALKSREDLFDIYVNPIGWGQTSWISEDNDERKHIDFLINKTFHYMSNRLPFDTTLMVTIPNEWEKYRAAPENIGICAGIEADRVSPHWLEASNRFVDKIIVTSSFSKKVFEDSSWGAKDPDGTIRNLTLQKPIEYVNYSINEPFVEPDPKILSGIELDHDFNFLCVAQWGPRKNIHNTIKYFLDEFKEDEVGLVLKLSMKDSSTVDHYYTKKEIKKILKEYPDRKCSVHLLHGSLSDEEMASLLVHPRIKSMINFGHGEGYGLPLFEAAIVGLPIITHDWGGQRDFLFAPKKDKKTKKEKVRPFFSKVAYDLKPIQQEAVWDSVLQPESQWAYPNGMACKVAMRQTYEHYNLSLSQAKKLKKWVADNFNEEKIHKELVSAVLGDNTEDNEVVLSFE
jgi:glycosyltransferase involved in cell wall biosynthesis